MVQVANAAREDPVIRCQAVEALADMAMVHSDEIISEDIIVRALLRLMEDGGEPVLQRVAAEAAAKLLFSGRIVRSPSLMAQLVRAFVHPFESSEKEDAPSSAARGSAAHLDQILSVFFPAFFGAGGERGGIIAVQAAAHLVADSCRAIRDEAVDSMKINQVRCQHLSPCSHNTLVITHSQMLELMIGWCQFLPAPISDEEAEGSAAKRAEAAMRLQICVSSLKEMLLLDSSRPAHKLLLKDLTKTLTALSPCASWLPDQSAVSDPTRRPQSLF